MNGLTFILGLLILGGAVAAVSLRNLVHCALASIGAFLGLAGMYLQLGAEFVGLVQILVYVGAVGILLVFAILLTRGGAAELRPLFSSSWRVGAAASVALALVLLSGIFKGGLGTSETSRPTPPPAMKDVGQRLMTEDVLSLEIMALLLTAASIGAIVLAMPEPHQKEEDRP